MKKTLLTLLGVLVLGAGFAMAQDDLFYTDDVWSGGVIKTTNALSKLVNWEDVWGFNKYETDLLECSSTGDNVVISTPIARDDIEDPVYGYELFLSPYRLSDLRAGNIDIDLSKFVLKQLKLDVNASEVVFEIPADELDPTQVYYGFVAPFQSYNLLGNTSSEFCFQIEAGQCTWSTEACDALELVLNPVVDEPEPVDEPVVDEPVVDEPNPDEQHGAACIGMDSAHVSHTVKGNVITLTWIAVDGDSVEISVWDPEEEFYRTLGTVKMSDEKFSYTMQWNGEHNFSLTNGCKEVRYKVDAAIKNDEPKPIPSTPATGPAENVLYIAIAAIIIYALYSVMSKKSEN